MKKLEPNINSFFNISNKEKFDKLALEVFNYQYHNNNVYRQFVDLLGVTLEQITEVSKIPFLPISFFKTHEVKIGEEETVFKSSGTSGQFRSQHKVSDVSIYEKSFTKAFSSFYGDISEYCFLGLLPSYIEQGESSLVYMVNDFITKTKENGSDFYLNDFEKLNQKIKELESENKKFILIGVSYALLDFIEKFPQQISSGIIMETGGMKGRRQELTKAELHTELKKGFGTNTIHSEYGMTELLSQAYSSGQELYVCPNWMKVLTRSTTDPLAILNSSRGLINVIDLANVYSCSFIATDDLGFVNQDGSFKILGRFDTSEIRGCNLMLH
jgi:phenylacetate-coenzyme A ligase PaaK-like adenylate-forming protein